MNIDKLFFELIQVSLGVRVCLSHSPTDKEWKMLYDIAQKQSLLGVCFAGVQRLQVQQQDTPEMLYLTWMGMAAKIQQRNEVVSRQCVELQEELAANGLRSCILKGQGVASLYSEHLLGLRQSGDIDVWVDCGREKAIEYTQSIQNEVDWDYKHLHLRIFPDTEVEMHYVPEVFLNLRKNRKLQKWFKDHHEQMFTQYEHFVSPSLNVNLFYILLHTYRHFLYEGVGLRQLMDYYFVLSNPMVVDSMRHNTMTTVKEFGMTRFTKGVMWIMKDVFGLEDKYLLCETDVKEGCYILNEVMTGGNFGHHDERLQNSHSGKWSAISKILKHNQHLLAHYPSDVVWAPIWIVYHKIWKLKNR